MGIPVKNVLDRWAQIPAYREADEALGEEYAFLRALLDARLRAKLSQAQVAERMGTQQSVVARLEAGRSRPTMSTLERYAAAVGGRLRITIEPLAKRPRTRGTARVRAAE